jgi:hypothetical protein
MVSGVSLASVYPPEAGTERAAAVYYEATESYLTALDLNDPALKFKRLGGTTATNWSVAKDGRVVADLKCTSGNTDHHGAVIAYRLGRELGFNIYPVAVYRKVDRSIDGTKISQQCALKEWESVFTQYYWTRDTFASTDSPDKRSLGKALDCQSAKPEKDDEFLFSARSAYGDPKPKGAGRVPYSGRTSLLEATRDFSNMMVVDALIGNEDRFPGGNLFFRSVTTSHVERQDGIVFEDARLYSLDNEAAFKGQTPASTHSARDLKTYVSRFDADMIARLQRVAEDPEVLRRITDGDETLEGFIREGIRIVLEQHAEAQSRCGGEMATF